MFTKGYFSMLKLVVVIIKQMDRLVRVLKMKGDSEVSAQGNVHSGELN